MAANGNAVPGTMVPGMAVPGLAGSRRSRAFVIKKLRLQLRWKVGEPVVRGAGPVR